jgi:hypothetical protein
MPRYYFDVWEADGLTLDDEGIELRDIEAVQNAAVRSLADMAREAVNSRSTVGNDMAIEVRDADGPVLQVKLTLAIERPKLAIMANGVSAGGELRPSSQEYAGGDPAPGPLSSEAPQPAARQSHARLQWRRC